MKDSVTDLCERMDMLRLRYLLVFNEITTEPIDYTPLAEGIVRGLAEGDATAVTLARAAVDMAEAERSEFWSTPLGRLMFVAGAWPKEGCTQATAAAVLGCSRQWVSAMVAEGKLSGGVVGGVYAEEVRKMLQARAARLVDIPVK